MGRTQMARTLVAAERVRVRHDGEIGDDANMWVPLGSDSRRGVDLSVGERGEGARATQRVAAGPACWVAPRSWATGKKGKARLKGKRGRELGRCGRKAE